MLRFWIDLTCCSTLVRKNSTGTSALCTTVKRLRREWLSGRSVQLGGARPPNRCGETDKPCRCASNFWPSAVTGGELISMELKKWSIWAGWWQRFRGDQSRGDGVYGSWLGSTAGNTSWTALCAAAARAGSNFAIPGTVYKTILLLFRGQYIKLFRDEYRSLKVSIEYTVPGTPTIEYTVPGTPDIIPTVFHHCRCWWNAMKRDIFILR